MCLDPLGVCCYLSPGLLPTAPPLSSLCWLSLWPPSVVHRAPVPVKATFPASRRMASVTSHRVHGAAPLLCRQGREPTSAARAPQGLRQDLERTSGRCCGRGLGTEGKEVAGAARMLPGGPLWALSLLPSAVGGLATSYHPRRLGSLHSVHRQGTALI